MNEELSRLQTALTKAEDNYKANPSKENKNAEIVARDNVEVYLKWHNNIEYNPRGIG